MMKFTSAQRIFRPTLVCLLQSHLKRATTNACLASNACRIDVAGVLLEEADSGSKAGKVIADAASSGRTVPVDITVDIINKIVRDTPTNNVFLRDTHV